MDAIATILSWIGFIVVLAIIVGLGMIVFLCLSIRKCDREEERAVLEGSDRDDDTKPYPRGVGPGGIH